eukprot:GHUV01027046.1.p1 GENE.GHUV01027046.1~~GHUV01027046.1.p1  ORF type:complete len:270 (+),score=58.31 GHUV01027046.1:259-1068(+)
MPTAQSCSSTYSQQRWISGFHLLWHAAHPNACSGCELLVYAVICISEQCPSLYNCMYWHNLLQVCTLPSARGDLDVLEWLRAGPNPCPWDASTSFNAARSGKLDILQWLAQQQPPCPFDQETICTGAARSGRVDILEFVRSLQPQPRLTVDTLKAAVKKLELVQWLRAQEPPCPWSEEACTAAASTGNVEVRSMSCSVANGWHCMSWLVAPGNSDFGCDHITMISPCFDAALQCPVMRLCSQHTRPCGWPGCTTVLALTSSQAALSSST